MPIPGISEFLCISSRRHTRTTLPRVVAAASVAISFVALGASAAQAYGDPYDTPLSLVNGWQGAPYGTAAPGVQFESYPRPFGGPTQQSVHLTGGIWGGSSSVAFTLPPAYRPSTTRYVPVDMCNATNGRLIITPSGTVIVQAESSFSNAQCFTSLEGVSYSTWLNPPS